MIKINLNLLLAACECCAKHDVRRYFEFVHIKHGAIHSSDGYIAFYCPVEAIDRDFDLAIPPNVIKALAKHIHKKERDTMVEIVVQDEFAKLVININHRQHVQAFVHDDVGRMPNIKLLIDELGETVDCMPSFDWQYVMTMQKIHQILSGMGHVLIKPTGKKTPAKIEFNKNAIGIIVPS